MDLRGLLQLVVDEGASDLHITNDSPPVLRIDGQMNLFLARVDSHHERLRGSACQS